MNSSNFSPQVRDLFTCDDPDDYAEYRLSELVVKGNMKKTVLAVLDSCVNPDIPFLKKYEDEDDKEEEVEQMSNINH